MVEFAFFVILSACLLQDKSLPMLLPGTLPLSVGPTSGYGCSSQNKGASFCWLYELLRTSLR